MRDAAKWLGDDPLVAALAIDEVDLVDVAALTERLGGGRFVGVVVARDADELVAVLAVLRGHVDEVVFTSEPGRAWRGDEPAAMVALGRGGLGQDFVFEVAELLPAVRYACRAVRREPDSWEGTGVLVVASASGVDAVRQALSSGCS